MNKTCADCIHNTVCNAIQRAHKIPKVVPEYCRLFKDKSQYIELNCKDVLISKMIYLRYEKKITWNAIAYRTGQGSGDACRMMVKRYFEKALKCCSGIGKCIECPYIKIDDCAKQNAKDVIDLINRQKAEIEEYKEANKRWSAALNNANEENSELQLKIASCNLEIEKLKIGNDALRMSIELCKGWEERAKADAIKELVDRLKKLYETYPDDEEASALYLIRQINEIVKEMKGNKDE